MTAIGSGARAAAVPSRTEIAWRRAAAWLGQGRGLRFGLALAAGLLGRLLERWSGPPPAGPLPVVPFVAFAAGLLFGVPGIVGACAGSLLGGMGETGAVAALVGAAALAATGAAPRLIFRFVPGLGRGLPNLRSYLWLLASALLGGLLTALAAALAAGAGPPRVWPGAAGSLASILLLAPPALLLADRHARRFLAPIRGETPARRSRALDPLAPPPAAAPLATGDETVVLAAPLQRPRLGRGLLAGGAMVLAVTALVVPCASLLPQGGGWTLLLYLVPILWGALHFGLRGGVLAASAGGLAFLVGLAAMDAATGQPGIGYALWSYYANLLVLGLAGAFVGELRERESQLRDELVESNRALRRDLLRVAQALIQAVHAKDAYTGGHLRRVSGYAVAVGERLGMRGQDLERLHYASLLHDIGKLGVPEELLQKAGPLDPEEAETMRRHPEIGARLLEQLDLLSAAAPLVLHHQERYDGERRGDYPGYPRGLAGEEIPLGSRVIAVVDAFDAITTSRPYREALPAEQAVAVLREERGRQFDPRVVDAFLAVLAERPWELE
jgi:HD domain-containing protein